MANFVDEPPSFKERFDRQDADLATIKKALGVVIAGLGSGQMALDQELMEALGLKQQRVLPAGLVRP